MTKEGDAVRQLLVALTIILGGTCATLGQPATNALLQLEAKVPLGAVSGRIDHMAIDLDRRRLFVAELGNDSVGIVDLNAKKVIHRISGLKEPQGVAYVKTNDLLYVANGGDGSVRYFAGPNYSPAGRIDLGADADRSWRNGSRATARWWKEHRRSENPYSPRYCSELRDCQELGSRF